MLPVFNVSTGLSYEENDPIPPSVLISPNVTSHVVSVTVTFETAGETSGASTSPEFNVYYTIDSVEDPSPYLQNGYWYVVCGVLVTSSLIFFQSFRRKLEYQQTQVRQRESTRHNAKWKHNDQSDRNVFREG